MGGADKSYEKSKGEINMSIEKLTFVTLSNNERSTINMNLDFFHVDGDKQKELEFLHIDQHEVYKVK